MVRTFKTYSLIQPEDSFDAVFLVSKVELYYTLIIMKYSAESARTWKPFLKLLFALSERSLNLTESHYKMGMIILLILFHWVIVSLKEYVCAQTVCEELGAI